MKKHNILVIQPLPGLGDLAWFDIHMQSIANTCSTQKISLLTKPILAPDIFENCAYIKEVLVWKKHTFRELLRLIRTQDFTEAWVLHHSWRYIVACKLAGIHKIYGYGNNWARMFLTAPVLSQKAFNQHPIKRATTLLKSHGLALAKSSGFQADPISEQSIREKFYHYKKPWIVLGIGGTETFKKWPVDCFANLAHHLKKQGTVFIFGGLKEEEEAKEIAALSRCSTKELSIVPLTNLNIQESLAFLKLSDYFIGNDTGMMNFSALLGKPTLGLFLKSFPLRYRKNMFCLQGEIHVATVLHFLENNKEYFKKACKKRDCP